MIERVPWPPSRSRSLLAPHPREAAMSRCRTHAGRSRRSSETGLALGLSKATAEAFLCSMRLHFPITVAAAVGQHGQRAIEVRRLAQR